MTDRKYRNKITEGKNERIRGKGFGRTARKEDGMSRIYKGTLGLIGKTPLVEVVNVEKELGLEAKLLVKL